MKVKGSVLLRKSPWRFPIKKRKPGERLENKSVVPGDLKRIFPNYHFYEIHLAAKVSFGFYYRSDREDIRSFIKMVKER